MKEAEDPKGLRLEFAEKAYREVLDATKHQDDKIGRFLTAIAFLFTGAIAFGTRGDLLAVRVVFGNRTVALPAILLAMFLVSSIVSVLLLLVALGPNLKLPRPEREEGKGHSPLFFLSIAGRTRNDWQGQWQGPGPSVREMGAAFVGETHNLATKTDFKYSRTNEARAVFTLGLLFLALSLGLWVKATVSVKSVALTNVASGITGLSGAPLRLDWDLWTRILVGGIVALFTFVLAYDYLRLDQEVDYFVKRKMVRYRLLPLLAVMVLIPFFVVLLIVTPAGAWSRVLAYGAFTTAASTGIALVGRAQLAQKDQIRHVWSVVAVVAGVFMGLLGWWAMNAWPEDARLWFALSVVGLLEFPRLFIASYWWYHRRAAVISERDWGGSNESVVTLKTLGSDE